FEQTTRHMEPHLPHSDETDIHARSFSSCLNLGAEHGAANPTGLTLARATLVLSPPARNAKARRPLPRHLLGRGSRCALCHMDLRACAFDEMSCLAFCFSMGPSTAASASPRPSSRHS